MIKGFPPWIRAKTNSKSKRKEKEREAGKIKWDISSIAWLMAVDIGSEQMDATPFWSRDFFSDTTHFLLIKFVLHYAEYFKQHFSEGLFIVGSNFRNEHLLGKALLP